VSEDLRREIAEYASVRRKQTQGVEQMLVAMRLALDSLTDDNDPASAEEYLRTCLRKFGR
jgi:hypothetical protein